MTGFATIASFCHLNKYDVL